MTKFWQRRICIASNLWSCVVIAAYGASFIPSSRQVFAYLVIDTYTLVAAIAALGIGAAILLFNPPRKYTVLLLLLLYACQLATVALLILNNGGLIRSPYLILWSLLAVTSFAIGSLAAILIVSSTVAYLMFGATQHELQLIEIIYLSLSTYLPLVISYTLWGRHMPLKPIIDQEERNYHQLASELRQVAGKSEVVINAIDDGVIALDSQGTIELINPAAQRMIGWGKHDALGLSYKSVLKLVDARNQDMTDANDPIAKTLSTNQSLVDESLSLVTSAGKQLQLSIVATPVGQLGAGVIVVFRNITSQKAEEREQAEFISTASHEMRTPVASIEGYLGLALNPSTAQIDDKARDFITKAHTAAQHLGHLFQDLLDVTKADDGRIVSSPQVVDLIPLIAEVVDGFATQAAAKQLHLIFSPTSGIRATTSPIYYIDVDINHLREVLSNLVENGIKYTARGEVVIDVNGDDNHVTISIRDTGIGIPKEDQGHLFQKFYRVDNSDTRTIGGTGLGLYLCRKLTESMGGRIWVESDYQKGSTFYLDFPRLSQEEAMRRIDAAAITAAVLPTATQHTTPAPLPSSTATAPTPIPVTFVPTPPTIAPAAQTPPLQPIPQPTPPPAPPLATSSAPAHTPPITTPSVAPLVAPPPLQVTPVTTPTAPSLEPVTQPAAMQGAEQTPAPVPSQPVVTRPAPTLVTDRQLLS